jgi:hypothetical protein
MARRWALVRVKRWVLLNSSLDRNYWRTPSNHEEVHLHHADSNRSSRPWGSQWSLEGWEMRCSVGVVTGVGEFEPARLVVWSRAMIHS